MKSDRLRKVPNPGLIVMNDQLAWPGIWSADERKRGVLMCPIPIGELLRLQRSTQQISLNLIAIMLAQECRLLLCFHAFGNYLQS